MIPKSPELAQHLLQFAAKIYIHPQNVWQKLIGEYDFTAKMIHGGTYNSKLSQQNLEYINKTDGLLTTNLASILFQETGLICIQPLSLWDEITATRRYSSYTSIGYLRQKRIDLDILQKLHKSFPNRVKFINQ